MQSYDVVYSISDLHLGGSTIACSSPGAPIGVQAFRNGSRLARWIDSIAPSRPGEQVALVINGDFVDFLAENPQQLLDFDDPASHLRRVASDGAFAPVFDSLAKFVHVDGCHLVVVIGNHDVELLHPAVQRALIERLNNPRSDKLEFALDGTGYLCSVGGRTVYFTHGNEHDSFNLVDQRALRRLLQKTKRGIKLEQGEVRAATNAGTRLVIDVMNEIKRTLPFVDLLKPEIEMVIPILASIPTVKIDAKRFASAREIAMRIQRDSVRRRGGLLGDDAPQGDDNGAIAGEQWTNDDWKTIETLQNTVDPVALARSEGDGTLGAADALIGWWRGKRSDDALRDHLESYMKRDGRFAFYANNPSDPQFVELDEAVHHSIDFTVAGHTHLARLIKRTNGHGFYLNSGTWMRLLRVSLPILADKAEWARAKAALLSANIEDIERYEWDTAPPEVTPADRKLVHDRCSVVKIEHRNSTREVIASLLVVSEKAELTREQTYGPDPASLPALPEVKP